MKSYSNDIVSSEKLQQQLDSLKVREDTRFKWTLILIAVLGLGQSALAGIVVYTLMKI